ncbi:MAG: ATP-binding protein [Bacillota bacterium]
MKQRVIFETEIEEGDFSRGGEASSKLKGLLHKLGVKSTVVRKAAIVTYELEMNIIIHSRGGQIKAALQPDNPGQIILYVDDRGPGIEDVEQAFKPGFSTATEEIREMGFGAGMGLNNVKQYSDRLEFESVPGKGTSIEVSIFLDQEG